MAGSREPVRMTLEQMTVTVEKAFGELDQARASALGQLADIQEARLHVFERDQKRLAEKLGEAHPRVAALSRSLDLGRSVVAELRLEQATAAAPAPEVDEKSWAFHGRVLSASRRPEKGLTVALFQGDVVLRQFGTATTDSNGHFVLRATSLEGVPQQPSVRVLREGRVIHVEDSPATVRPGHSEFREIVLGDDTRIPPQPRAAEGTPPEEEP